MAYSKPKMKSSVDKAPPCFRPFWIGIDRDVKHLKQENSVWQRKLCLELLQSVVTEFLINTLLQTPL
jgi:hypothetical protein